jgi:8-oxo-dGTP pyrophosphatase MutT (NUDIX family)
VTGSRRPRQPGPQKIPRPPVARPGAPPPWSPWHDASDRPHITSDDVRRAVTDLPDLPPVPGPPVRSPAAILCAVFDDADDGGEAHVILTRRTEWMRSHSHQVAFPGGRCEDDEDPVDAALRESQEEIGLDPGSVEIVGRLTKLGTITNPEGAIHPFVGVIANGRPVYDPNPDEVERVFDVALADLMEEGCFREEIWGIAETERPIYFLELDGETIWGATARMLVELLTLVATEQTPRRAPER